MRTARLVGPGPDGTSLTVADDQGEELVLAVDDRLRAAVGAATPPTQARPRPARRETPMDDSLSPRDIQTRIRAGATVDDLVETAGLPRDRVERFAAPVLAEREHLALLAAASSVRRRGETSGHRNLRGTVGERLLKRGVDVDTVEWDAHRLDDGRWAVTADYALSGQDQHASFLFDVRGRFSVPADEAARWLVGESAPGPVGPSRGESAAEEPTVDLSDELALVRAVQEPPEPEPQDDAPAPEAEPEPTGPARLRALPSQQPQPEPAPEPAEEPVPRPAPGTDESQDTDEATDPEQAPDPEATPDAEATADADEDQDAPALEQRSELTELYAMLGSDGYSEDSPRVYAGLSDASAVPETAGGGWEPAIVVDYPVEPSPADEAELAPGEHPDRSQVPMNDKAQVELSTPVDAGADQRGGTDEPAPPYARTNEADRAEEAEEFQLESEPAPPKPVKRKRASVPSWDEIMFGGPKPPG